MLIDRINVYLQILLNQLCIEKMIETTEITGLYGSADLETSL